MFAKLYGTDKDQILVKIGTNDEYKPEVRFYVKPEGLGVCTLAVSFADNDAGWANAQKCLDEMTEEKARLMAARITRSFVQDFGAE